MNPHRYKVTTFVFTLISLAGLLLSTPSWAVGQTADDTSITWIAVNGAGDTANPGTTCIKISSAVSSSCTAGFVAIQNNNKQLMIAALQAKATSGKIWFYYEDASVTQHCPGQVFTSCTVISIMLK